MAHALFAPKAYEKLFAQEEDKNIVFQLTTDLSPEEEATEFAKYYHMGIVPASEETLKSMESELAQEDIFWPEEYEKNMVKNGYMEKENGYRILEDGIAYGAAMTLQEGVDDTNMAYFNENFGNGPGDIFYKTWSPGVHLRLYPDVSMEDIGWGNIEVRVTGFFSAKDVGIQCNPEDVDAQFIDFNGMNVEMVPLGAPEGTEPVRRVDMSYFRQTENGREIRFRTWVGMSLENGKFVKYPVKDTEKLAEYTIKTTCHVASEAATAGRNVVAFYNDHH